MSLNASALAAKRRLELLQRGQQRVRRLVERGEVDRAREDVVRRLPHVHVVVRVRAVAGERRDDLVGVHVRRRARAGLEDVDRELRVVLARGDLVARGGDPLGQLGVEQPELGVHARGRALDAPEPADDRQRDAFSRNREVRDGLRGLAAPQLRARSPARSWAPPVIVRSAPYASAAHCRIELTSPVGCHGRVTSTGGIGPGRTGEVMVAIRGGVEAFLARDVDGGRSSPTRRSSSSTTSRLASCSSPPLTEES